MYIGACSMSHLPCSMPWVLALILRLDAMLQGNINLIEAAAKKGVKKFILVTSIGTGDSKDAPPTQVYDVLKPVLLEKEKAEEALKVRRPAVRQAMTDARDAKFRSLVSQQKAPGLALLSSSAQGLSMP